MGVRTVEELELDLALGEGQSIYEERESAKWSEKGRTNEETETEKGGRGGIEWDCVVVALASPAYA